MNEQDVFDWSTAKPLYKDVVFTAGKDYFITNSNMTYRKNLYKFKYGYLNDNSIVEFIKHIEIKLPLNDKPAVYNNQRFWSIGTVCLFRDSNNTILWDY